jgi:hypothetical protein
MIYASQKCKHRPIYTEAVLLAQIRFDIQLFILQFPTGDRVTEFNLSIFRLTESFMAEYKGLTCSFKLLLDLMLSDIFH